MASSSALVGRRLPETSSPPDDHRVSCVPFERHRAHLEQERRMVLQRAPAHAAYFARLHSAHALLGLTQVERLPVRRLVLSDSRRFSKSAQGSAEIAVRLFSLRIVLGKSKKSSW